MAGQMTFPIEAPAARSNGAHRPTASVTAGHRPAYALAGRQDQPVQAADTAMPVPAAGRGEPEAVVPMWQWRIALVAVLLVGLVAAVVSVGHIYAVAAAAGEKWAALMFVPVDGMTVAASMTISVRRRAGLRSGFRAWAAFLLGVGASLGFNVAAAEPTVRGRLIAALPSVAFLLSYELLTQLQQIKARSDTEAAT